MTDQPYHMWDYWSDNYGEVRALEDHYPETLADSEELKQAVAQYKNAKRVINNLMEEKESQEIIGEDD